MNRIFNRDMDTVDWAYRHCEPTFTDEMSVPEPQSALDIKGRDLLKNIVVESWKSGDGNGPIQNAANAHCAIGGRSLPLDFARKAGSVGPNFLRTVLMLPYRPWRSSTQRAGRRKAFIATILASVIAISCLATGAAVAQGVERPLPPIETTTGLLTGLVTPSGARAWLGVPFAAPPTNDLRWKPPQPFSWRGVWNADRLMPECIQPLRRHNINNYFGEEATSENCLYLNIWAPADKSRTKLPVIVFIFGGGDTIGSAGMRLYSGEKVADRGAIFVGLNYRLGILGFMAHPDLSQEQSGHSGNYAYLDQNAALRWVRANIERFGGDPTRISIVGQSAGARAVAQHIVSPLSKGLFSSAVMLSACRFDNQGLSLSQAEAIGQKVQSALGTKTLREMRALPADRILTVQSTTRVGPVIDGYFLPRPAPETFRLRENSDVPVIASSNGSDNDSLQSPLTKARTVAEYGSAVETLYGADAKELLKLYPANRDDQVEAVSSRLAQDSGMQGSARSCAQTKAQYDRTPTFISLFDRKHPYISGVQIADIDPVTVGAYHSSDLPYWLGTLEAFNSIRPTRVWTAEDRQMSDRMIDALIVFAQTGNPSTQTTVWPAWSRKNERRVVFARDISVEPLRAAGMDWLARHAPNQPVSPPPIRPRQDRD